jgi:hypothetical protein
MLLFTVITGGCKVGIGLAVGEGVGLSKQYLFSTLTLSFPLIVVPHTSSGITILFIYVHAPGFGQKYCLGE